MINQPKPLEQRIAALRKELERADPIQLAERIGARYEDQGQGQALFYLEMWGKEICLSFPGLEVIEESSNTPLRIDSQALLMYYFFTSDGTQPVGKWISFSELPDGKFYQQAFQGYTGGELTRAFGDELESFIQAAENLGGKREHLGDVSYSFQALPRLPVLIVYWQGDEDFPASMQILFDASAPHHLPTDVCAILGSMLARRLLSRR